MGRFGAGRRRRVQGWNGMRQPSISTTFLRPGADFEAKPRAEVRTNALRSKNAPLRISSVAV